MLDRASPSATFIRHHRACGDVAVATACRAASAATVVACCPAFCTGDKAARRFQAVGAGVAALGSVAVAFIAFVSQASFWRGIGADNRPFRHASPSAAALYACCGYVAFVVLPLFPCGTVRLFRCAFVHIALCRRAHTAAPVGLPALPSTVTWPSFVIPQAFCCATLFIRRNGHCSSVCLVAVTWVG